MQKVSSHFNIHFLCHSFLKVFLCLTFICWPLTIHGQDSDKENLVKAVVIYNFAKFTDWPDEAFGSPNAPIFFSATGESMSKTLVQFEGRQVKKRDIALKSFNVNPQYYTHILFISSSETESVDKILSSVVGKPILTVSDIPGFIHKGGMIGLVKVGGKIRFEINFDATREAGLKVSSQLLLLATVVVRDQGEAK